MKRCLKTIILLPLWPFIWLQLGLNLDVNCNEDDKSCFVCGVFKGGKCCRRAKNLVRWWQE